MFWLIWSRYAGNHFRQVHFKHLAVDNSVVGCRVVPSARSFGEPFDQVPVTTSEVVIVNRSLIDREQPIAFRFNGKTYQG